MNDTIPSLGGSFFDLCRNEVLSVEAYLLSLLTGEFVTVAFDDCEPKRDVVTVAAPKEAVFDFNTVADLSRFRKCFLDSSIFFASIVE